MLNSYYYCKVKKATMAPSEPRLGWFYGSYMRVMPNAKNDPANINGRTKKQAKSQNRQE